jgi:hypothetical protein
LHQQSDIEYARLNERQPSLLSPCVTDEGIAYWDKMQCDGDDDYDDGMMPATFKRNQTI